jgi:hypothetical protein
VCVVCECVHVLIYCMMMKRALKQGNAPSTHAPKHRRRGSRSPRPGPTSLS